MPELVGFVCKLATKYRALLRKLIYKEKAPCGSSQPYTSRIDTCFILSGEYSTTKNKKKRKQRGGDKEFVRAQEGKRKGERKREREKERERQRERGRNEERGGESGGGTLRIETYFMSRG